MKKVPCGYVGCGNRRIHWERPDILRGTQHIEVPDDFEGKAYCSIECMMYAKAQEKEITNGAVMEGVIVS